ncbi:VIT domain-containing protein [Flavobacterium nitrogenifigens]|uniref:TonB-dependent outer membrane receptor, SusC/RagA subfamily, signature region n=1 Tax=Flavobacterium nitrogenifigens TaxID=1617283 RepID=A0A521D8X0_9FLAO|nr:VIT domain-containing protein [Flavobacterium nitrogenifigens]KAF2337343.1 TonB-dependent receptor [Flavobacterium nitrogenifigens]SMO67340.1 TonB-dependent outer membrane receptor, SusC/RagA subfamily, signature region [Flavobacterium nitrogenifigens]
MKLKMFSSIRHIFQLNLNVLFFFLVFIGTKAFAQSPELTVKGEEAEKVRMSQLKVNVKIVGNIAYTTAEMHFFNSGTRQMEAELIFPLPENVSVSRYAIDINGKLREAVPVNKNKGKQVFEAIEHRRVDPGLLEKVDGNNFKTRIYPLMPNGERTVVIGYEEELSSSDKDNLAYQFLSRYPKKLDKFEINVSVLGASSTPTVAENSGKEIVFSKWDQSFQASVKKENYQPEEKLVFKIPIQQNIPSVVMQNAGGQYYFYGNTFIEGNKTAKKSPASIGLIWDNSLSCQNRDLKKELSLLDAYFQKIKNTKVTLYFLNYTFDKQQEYIISEGNWSALKAVLEKTRYDGGTRFSQLNFSGQDEYLFFTDGLSSLSENLLPKTKKPIYSITSSVSADFAFLNFSSTKTGGNFINLNQINAEIALDKLTNTNLKFLGIKENLTVTDLFPMEGTSVSGNFSFSGISLNPKNEITLLFGYNEAILERKISLDATIQNTADINVEKLWAQKKIANLELQYTKNADEIEILGKKFGIVTKNTSLIVLENVRDYIMYDILPPAELREEFDRIKKQEHDAALALQKNNWESIESYFGNINAWWKKNTKYNGQKIASKYKYNRQAPPPPPPPNGRNRARNMESRVGSETIKGDPDAVLTIDEPVGAGPVSTVIVEDNAVYDTPPPPSAPKVDQVKFVAPVVAKSQEITEDPPKIIDIKDKKVGSEVIRGDSDFTKLQDTITVGYGTQKKSDVTGAIAEDTSKNKDLLQDANFSRGYFAGDSKKPLIIVDGQFYEGEVTDLKSDDIETVEVLKDAARISAYGSLGVNGVIIITTKKKSSNSGVVQTKSWNPDRLYLKALASAPKEKQYDLYLDLRKSQERNPSFYFDVAHFFYNQGDIKKALLIVSNIADLGLENHQLYKTLTYTLRQWKDYNDAVFTAKQVVKWREHEPQSRRDYALTLEDTGKYQEAFDELVKSLEVNYYGEMSGQYEGVEDIVLMDINRLMSEHSGLKTGKLDKKYIAKMPVDIRIIMNWNQMDVDLDLHVIEPTGEECYYSHTNTAIGGRFSKDFTEGYGPEQYLVRNAVKGKYQIKSNYFGETELTENGPATVMIEIYTTKAGKVSRTLKTIQLGKVKENEVLAEINW